MRVIAGLVKAMLDVVFPHRPLAEQLVVSQPITARFDPARLVMLIVLDDRQRLFNIN